jgi:sulfhydrogenase subunit beta (sulfur reductase)
MGFKMDGKKIEIVDLRDETRDFVIFGVRACDAKSFDVLDRVFLSDPVDSYYKSRRDKGTVVTMACSAPEETCFCGVFGIDPTEPCGDAVTYLTEDGLFFEGKTEKGKTLEGKIAALFEDADTAEVEAQKAATKEICEKLPLSGLSLDGFGSEDVLLDKFNSPEWASLSEACLGCGTCTFVCPTCQCYDIRDFDTGHGITRFRCWDSCMYSDFTKTAGGQPRKTQLERFRQRFMHKLVYYPANNDGLYSCVGCGRCVAKCPISMNIAKVIKRLGGKN